jgi:uroporphyrin-3 C-methyltransferase
VEHALRAPGGGLNEAMNSPPQETTAPNLSLDPGPSPARAAAYPARLGGIALALALIAILLLAWQWLDGRSERQALRQELAQRLSEMDTQNREGRLIAGQAQDSAQDLQIKLGVLDDKLARSQNQQVALETLYQELSRNRDDWSIAEIEQILLIAFQQLQLAGDVRSALIALQTADSRLQRTEKPQLVPLRRVIAKDIERLKALPYVDTVGLSVKLDSIQSQVSGLPLAMQLSPGAEKAAASVPATDESAWQSFVREAWTDFKQMVRLQRLDKAEVPLLAPEQAYFARENLKLRLLSARIALLQRDQATFRADITAARDWLDRYFDTQSKAVINILASLRELGESPVDIDVPDISDSLEAVRNYKLARDEPLREFAEPGALTSKPVPKGARAK